MTATAPQLLAFPPEIFAALTPTPFLLAHLSPANPKSRSLRANGRSQTNFRTPVLHTDSLTHCSGSAVVRLGDTAIVCGIRGEILQAKDIPNAPRVDNLRDPNDDDEDMGEDKDEEDDDAEEISSLNLLVPNIELATGCSPHHLPGSPPTTLAQSLSHRLHSLLLSTRLLRARDLRILYNPTLPPDATDDEIPAVELAGYWTLYIDILVISLDGNAFDAAWCGILAALLDTKLPKAYYDPESEAILCSSVPSESHDLRLRGFPIPSTFAIFDPSREKGVDSISPTNLKKSSGKPKTFILTDPDSFEETICKEFVTVVIDYDGGAPRVKCIEKSGGSVVGRDEMRECVTLATRRWAEWNGILTD